MSNHRRHTLQLHDLAFLSGKSVFCIDDFESYTPAGLPVRGLNGGVGFVGSYQDKASYLYIQWADDLETYVDGSALDNTLVFSAGPDVIVDRFNFAGIQAIDDFETQSDGAAVNGLTGPALMPGTITDHVGYTGTKSVDDLESYSVGPVDGLNGGTDFGGVFVDR